MHVAGHLMLLYRHTRYTCLSVPVKHLQACRRASIPFFAAVLARAVVTDGHLAGEVGERGDDGDAARRSRHDARPRPCAALAAAERLQLTVDADGADGVGSSFRFWGDFGASGVATSPKWVGRARAKIKVAEGGSKLVGSRKINVVWSASGKKSKWFGLGL